MSTTNPPSLPPGKQGLYDPAYEHDACGVGFVADLQDRPAHAIVSQAIQVLCNLEHRGACGCETNTGDGAGILFQKPHTFLAKECEELRLKLPRSSEYGVGMVFLPKDPGARKQCEALFEQAILDEGQWVLGWRTVKTDNSNLGPTAKAGEPAVRQIFIGRSDAIGDDLAFERKLYVIRRRVENAVRASSIPQRGQFYIPSLSYKTIVYKGMLMSTQLASYYPELEDPLLESSLALVHSRFSTNTFPNWARAHPYRFLAHNGEINTLRGNINWMHARERQFESAQFGDDMEKLLPVIDTDGSDSAMFDNVLEMLTLAGRSLPHSAMMMIPEPWSGHESMSPEKKAFYEYHGTMMEPWDGPALIAFTDGRRIGAVLDRNGLRPARYYVTKNDLVVLASEVGVLSIPPKDIRVKGRLQPGRMFLIDLNLHRIVGDDQLKRQIALEKPYRKWLDENLTPLEAVPEAPEVHEPDHKTVLQRQHAFGYTTEDVKILVGPMAENGVEPLGSMGTDTPLAVLSERPQLLYNYFKQLFAQVTNPPVDAIREEIIMSTDTTIGAEKNLLDPQPDTCRHIKLKSPILTNQELEKLRRLGGWKGFKAQTLNALYTVKEDGPGLETAMSQLCAAASQAVADGATLIILSDRGVSPELAPIPALLAVSGVHHHLIREGNRAKVALIVESGEPREVHHFAMLLGYGAAAINPYLAFETIFDLCHDQTIHTDYEHGVKSFVKAVNKGIVKVISKMGISTIQSYRGAQIFEAIGLGQDLVDKYFTWTASRVGGVGLPVIAKEVRMRHERAYPDRPTNGHVLDAGGQYQWRREGEHHLFNPETIHRLQYACRNNNYKVFQEYSELVNNQSKRLCTLRGLMDLKFDAKPVPIEEVEPADSLVQRFKTGAMSYGSISKEAHEGLAIAMNRIGGKSNTGEGGEDPGRYVPDANGDSRNSAIKQVASGRFGVTSYYLTNAQELQIKIAQGAKPGEGGQLPGSKVYPWIAKVRHATPGVGLISPPPHHDIYSIEDLAELIYDLKCSNDRARISVKLVAEVGVGTIAAGVAKAKADVVLISGFDGGTGASPLTSIKHAGIPWELGVAETQQVLVLNNLRSRIVVEADGQLKTGRDVVVAAMLGAEEFGFATAPLVVLGCILMRVCHLNTCPVGVATQDPKLRAKFTGDPAHVVNFMWFIAQEVRELMAKLGFRRLEEMVGRTDRLEMKTAVEHWKAQGLDFGQILYQPPMGPEVGRFCSQKQDHQLEATLDKSKLIPLCKPALETAEAVAASLPIRNVDRTVGTILGSEVTRKWGYKGLPPDTITLHFQGSAGQSFGAFLPKGITQVLEGDANDYLGKGLSGGKLVVYPPREATFAAEENVIIGNVAFYGATDGIAFIRGMAGERFGVRNSGVTAVVEGVGDHGCEYMTGGKVVVLGPTGRNFAAGMSGGYAYVLDEDGTFASHCNQSMVGLYPLQDPEEIESVRTLVRHHAEATQSQKAWKVLALWDSLLSKLVKVLPHDFKRALEAEEKVREMGLTEDEAEMAAFEMNAKDAARLGGN
ncbi:MAG TPA: glutamate synthase large subunit [Planctomycetota bacterium]|nr:glutamate synthase large subunit [Planctomycetota bacterium]